MSDRKTATEAERGWLIDERFEIGGHTFQVRWVDHHVLMATYVSPHATKEYGRNAFGWDKENSGDYEKPEPPSEPEEVS